LVLAEPGGDLDPSLAHQNINTDAAFKTASSAAAALIQSGDIEKGVIAYVDALVGSPGA
jgi:hypothetical protein